MHCTPHTGIFLKAASVPGRPLSPGCSACCRWELPRSDQAEQKLKYTMRGGASDVSMLSRSTARAHRDPGRTTWTRPNSLPVHQNNRNRCGRPKPVLSALPWWPVQTTAQCTPQTQVPLVRRDQPPRNVGRNVCTYTLVHCGRDNTNTCVCSELRKRLPHHVPRASMSVYTSLRYRCFHPRQ